MKLLLAAALAALGFGIPDPILKPVGVCEIDEGSVACWDLQGAPNEDLGREVGSRLGENVYLGFVPHYKNRYLFAWQDFESQIQSYSTNGPSSVNFLTKPGDRTLIAIRAAADLTAKTGTVSLHLGIRTGGPAEIRLREGESATVEGVKLTVGRAEASPLSPWGGFNPPWRFGLDRTETEPETRLSIQALDRQGKLIEYVDEYGKPVDAAKGKALYDQIQAGKWDWKLPLKIFNSVIQDGGMYPGRQEPWIYMNIDPRSIARLRVHRVVDRAVTLGPFPLDPIQSKTP